MKRIGSIIVVIAFFCFLFSSCGGEPAWKQALSVLEQKLIKLEEIADKVKSGDEEAVKEAKKIVEEFGEFGKDQPELTGDEQVQAAKAAEELFEKYQTGVELLSSDLDSFVEAKKALEDALALIPDFSKLAGELEDLIKKYKGGDMEAGAQAQAKQKEIEYLYGRLKVYRVICTDDGKKQIDAAQEKLMQQYPFLQDYL